ncbi:MAG TPA: glycoside hydrolase family 38 C-terminal domain-containing protein [Bacteroidota bacterium]|nr:glycoside hydrolase family 38 C-terminal domain-containing protein [Bacteroidota bacterium]
MKLCAAGVILLSLLFTLNPALGGQPGGDIVINVTTAAPSSPAPGGNLLNGFRQALKGQTIVYHSSHPDAEEALIVRANSEANSASWETDTVPSGYRGDTIRFIWIAGLERSGWGESKTGHPFRLYIDGRLRLTFRNFKDSTASHWSVSSADGTRLSFSARIADRFGDQFGYMYLSLPRKDAAPGKPLVLSVVGEEAGSLEWYMTFQYRFSFTPSVRAEPALFRDGDGARQVLRVSLDNLQPGSFAEISAGGSLLKKDTLRIGANIYSLPIPAVSSPSGRTLLYRVNGITVCTTAFTVRPVQRRDIYLLSHSHNDIGYTDIQTVVEQKQWRNIDEALRLIDATRDYPPDARYRWNIEVLWPLESYLRQADETRKAKLLDAIREGSIGINALYGNELTGLATSVEMSHFTDYARSFSREYGIPVTTALVSDIPGFTWGIVPALAQSGIRYFASGPNSGDRIGFVLSQWGDRPFYWTSQSGGEKVLFWVAGAGYSSFHEGTLAKLGDEKLMKMMRRLDETGYPYSIVQMPYTLGDNGPPDSTLSDYVRRWNATYLSPRLIIATHRQMFEEFERRHGRDLPVFAGDFTPYWEDGAQSTAFETALCRRAVGRLVEAEALWSMRAPGRFPAGEDAEAWRNVVLYDEHTWGAGNSVEQPDDPEVKKQWEIKRGFALTADSLSHRLLDTAFGYRAGPAVNGSRVAIFNPTGWSRSDVTMVPASLSAGGDEVIDSGGRSVPAQRLADGDLAVKVDNLPPFSSEILEIRKGGRKPAARRSASGTVLENGNLRLSVDPRTGSVSELYWKSGGKQFVSGTAELNKYLYVPGTDPDSARSLLHVTVTPGEWGKLIKSLIVAGDAPGCRNYRTEIRITEGTSRVDIVTVFDKLAVREKEGMHVAFPFAVPDAAIRYDVANGIVRPEKDQLAGSCRNFFSVQSWVDVSNAGYGITLATPDVPLIELGRITAEKPWMTSADTTPPVYSYVMNNYWHTNYKADQEGITEIRYALMPHAAFHPDDAVRFGRECREPLLVTPAGKDRRPVRELFRLEPAGVVTESVRPVEGGWLIYLYNPAADSALVRIRWNTKSQMKFSRSGPDGMPGGQPGNGFLLPGYGSAYVRVERD